jgi:hypothetical protein
MKYVVFVLLLAATTALNAQQLAGNSASSLISPVIFKSRALPDPAVDFQYPGERMRNTGRVLTILGSALFVGGIGVYSSADSPGYSYTSTNSGTYEEGDPKAALGILMIGGGAGMAIPGIIFWSKGSKRYKAALLEEEPEASIHLRSNGLAIRYRF